MYAPERGFLWGRKCLQLFLSPWAQMDECHYSYWLDKSWFRGAQQETNHKPQTLVVWWAVIVVLRGWCRAAVGWDSAVKQSPAAVFVGREAQWFCCSFSELPQLRASCCLQSEWNIALPAKGRLSRCLQGIFVVVCRMPLLEALCTALLRQKVDCLNVKW